jgi:Na+-driven multidrug efflux pump
MLKLGLSPALQRMIFTFIAIIMGRIISQWGGVAIAIQKIGVQIEAVSYLTASGFSTALSTISGNSFGAGNFKGQWNNYIAGMILAITTGLFITAIFILFPETLFSFFLSDQLSLKMGKDYIIILGYSQVFMCVEFVSTGAFYGWGKTNTPAAVSISLTFLRIPMALFLIEYISRDIDLIWWSISITSILKGVILSTLFVIQIKSFLNKGLIIK